MTSSHLFRLPQELRDQIYEYALYDPNGLHYRKCSDGVVRLCTRRKRYSTRHAITTWIYRCSPKQLARKCTDYSEKNQLKYVCKRLCVETRGLEAQHNLIVFEDIATMDALEQYMVFHAHCTWYREVAIKCSLQSFTSNYDNCMYSKIATHCTANADLVIRIHIPYWSQADPSFVHLGLHFLSTFRPETSFNAQLAHKTLVPSQSDLALHSAMMQVPSNLRLCPKEERFRQHILERTCRKHPRVRLPTTEAALREVIEMIEGWFENGL